MSDDTIEIAVVEYDRLRFAVAEALGVIASHDDADYALGRVMAVLRDGRPAIERHGDAPSTVLRVTLTYDTTTADVGEFFRSLPTGALFIDVDEPEPS